MHGLVENPPVIFIHKGDSDYLRYVVRCAKDFNPEKRIIFLGDESNAYLKSDDIEHYYFSDYSDGAEIQEFERVFKVVRGHSHGKEDWLKFVFKRWYHINNFIRSKNLKHFWTFDSDTLILRNLSTLESKFVHVDCTEQCKGICMNGFISNVGVVNAYVKKMNELFEREEYLKMQEKEFELTPTYAYTEMRAYETFRFEHDIKTVYIGTVLDNEIFDDCICSENGMATYEYKVLGNRLKKIFIGHNNDVYFFYNVTGKYVRANTINMSWVPTYIYKRILKQLRYTHKSIAIHSHNDKLLKLVNVKPTFGFNCIRYLNKLRGEQYRIRQRVISYFR